MLIHMGTLLQDAKKNRYGVAAPNVWSINTARVVFEAAQELKAPVILDVAGIHRLEESAEAVKFYAKKFPEVTAALNLDHGGNFEEIVEAIRLGFSSVMVDRSTLSFDENVREVSEIVKIAHAVGVSVEAELGHVGQGFEYEETRDAGLTRKEEAVEFVKKTGVDCLAVSVGTSHGTYKGTPKLEFELLKELSEMIEVPLVLHGGSGTGDENLKKAVLTGIQKVNLNTDLSNAGIAAMEDYMAHSNANMFDMSNVIADGYKQKLIHYMRLFGGEGRAK